MDESDYGTEPRLLFYIEDAIQDGVTLSDGANRVISRHLHFVELKEDGSAVDAGFAPYLDYRAVSDEEQSVIRPYIRSQRWLCGGVEDMAVGYAISDVIPAHFSAVRERRNAALDKITRAVKTRMTKAIQYWDFRAGDLKRKEAAGKVNARLNSENARRRAEDLAERMRRRLAELAEERNISALPPVIAGGALVIPKGLLHRLTGQPLPPEARDNQAVEFAAMKAVMDVERALGYIPRDVSRLKKGYDIESAIPEELRDGGATLRFIEVKGHRKGAGRRSRSRATRSWWGGTRRMTASTSSPWRSLTESGRMWYILSVRLRTVYSNSP